MFEVLRNSTFSVDYLGVLLISINLQYMHNTTVTMYNWSGVGSDELVSTHKI